MQQPTQELLCLAIEELKSMPTVDIKGKRYTQVSTRINIFRKYFPLATLETNIIHNDDIRVIIQSKIKIDNTVISTGYAEEVRGDGNYINSTSAVENCETSSIGRALSSFGLAGGEYASSFEVSNAISQQSVNNTYQQSTQPYQAPHANQQDYSSLINAGLNVVEQDGNLVVIGKDVFNKKDIIKQHNFRWDSNNKRWFIPLHQVA